MAPQTPRVRSARRIPKSERYTISVAGRRAIRYDENSRASISLGRLRANRARDTVQSQMETTHEDSWVDIAGDQEEEFPEPIPDLLVWKTAKLTNKQGCKRRSENWERCRPALVRAFSTLEAPSCCFSISSHRILLLSWNDARCDPYLAISLWNFTDF
jgi:hypothetical protein